MNTIKVALVEDDPAIVRMYEVRFGLAGFDVQVANNGENGLKLIADFKPDIVLMDLMMPVMSGIEALTRLRQQAGGASYKIIALTNMKDVDTAAKLKNLNVDDYIVKAEMSPSQIVDRIEKLVKIPA